MSRNIFNDATETGINQRTINFQNLSVLDATIPILNTGNVVSGQLAGIAGLDLISKDTLDDVKDDVLGTRLKNLSTATISTESIATINGDTVNSTPVSTAGKNLLNITSIADLRSQILETTEEAVVFTADTNNEINFYTGSTQTASDLRLRLTNELIMLQTGDESMNIKLDNQSTWISFSEQLVFDNLEGPKINFYKTGSVIEDNLYTLEVDTTTGGTKTLVYVSPEEHLFQVRDTSTQPLVGVLQDILLVEKDHVHITSDNGIMINGGFNIKNGNHGELATTNGNKDLYYKTHGTGEHIFYVDDTTEILKVDSTGVNATTFIGDLNGNVTGDLTGDSAGVHTGNVIGDVTGNSDTSTKIATITNSNIVQLDDIQTLTNKTITGEFTGNLLTATANTGQVGEGNTRLKSIYVNNIYKKNTIYYRVVNLPSTPTQNDYNNVYTLDYFYSLPLYADGGTITYNLDTLENMTAGLNWSALSLKGMILDFTIKAPKTGTMYLKHTSDDGARIFINESSTPLTTLTALGNVMAAPATWANQAPTTGYASFSITVSTLYRIRLQYTENAGGQECRLEWNTDNIQTGYTTDWTSIIVDNDIGNPDKRVNTIRTLSLNATGKIETSDTMSSQYYRSIYYEPTFGDDLFNEIEMVKIDAFPTIVDTMNFTFNKTESTSGNTLMSIDGINDKIMTYAKLELHDDLLLNSNVDLASLTTQFQNGYIENVYVREVRVFGGYGGGAYIDLRPTSYTADAGSLYNTPPIYFNTGQYSLGQNDSELRKSMIFGSPLSAYLPTGELNTNSRNNIVLCCRTAGDNQNVDITDEKLRIGQNGVYINTDLIPKSNISYDIGNANFKFVNGYIDNLFSSIIDFPETLSDKIKLYGDLYKLTVSNNSLDYTTGNTHTFYQSTNKLFTMDNTENVSYRKFEAHNTNGGVVACAGDGVNVSAMRYNSGLGCEFAGVFGFNTYITSQTNLYLNPGSTHSVICNKPLMPSSNGGFDLGASGNKWKEIWATVSAINTSDRTKKKEINYEDIDDYADELLNLRPCSYKMIDGTSNRPHTGLIAQDMEGTKFEKSGCYIKTPKTKTITEYKSIDGGKTQTPVDKTVNVEGEYEYGLRYGEMISPLIRLCQKQQEQINQLIKRIDLLENGTGNELSFI